MYPPAVLPLKESNVGDGDSMRGMVDFLSILSYKSKYQLFDTLMDKICA